MASYAVEVYEKNHIIKSEKTKTLIKMFPNGKNVKLVNNGIESHCDEENVIVT